MILSYRKNEFSIPESSRCVVHTTGIIKKGDVVSITSPIFTSVDFNTGAVNMSERFDVPVSSVSNADGSFVNDKADGKCFGVLRCYDNDPFRMFVEL